MIKERRQNHHLTFIKVSGGIQANNPFLLIEVPLNNAFPHPSPLLAARCLAPMGREICRDIFSQDAPHLPRAADPWVWHGEGGITSAQCPLPPVSPECCSPDQKDPVCLLWQGKTLPFRCLLPYESELARQPGLGSCVQARERVSGSAVKAALMSALIMSLAGRGTNSLSVPGVWDTRCSARRARPAAACGLPASSRRPDGSSYPSLP